MPRLTQEQIATIAELREADGKAVALAKQFKVSKGTVSWHCLKSGVVGSGGILGDRGPMVRYRNGKPVRRFTPEEDARLLALAETIPSRRAIGREMERSPQSVVARLFTLARRAEAA